MLSHIHGAHSTFAEELDDTVRADEPSDHLVALELLRRDGGHRLVETGSWGERRIRHAWPDERSGTLGASNPFLVNQRIGRRSRRSRDCAIAVQSLGRMRDTGASCL